ncbi:MAG: N-acetyltransferase [Alphaproteobacteria bacterium]|nr:N-acetyltransferase [Alphaproteobacteria bacterium]
MIRKSTNADIEKMLEIWLDGSKQSHDFVAAEYWQKMLPSVRKYYLPNTETYVFEDKHQIKGFISAIDDRYVGALFVAKKYQNQRIGSKLLGYLKNIYPELSLKVFAKNKDALRFYQKNGFKIMAEQVDEGTKEQELLMSWAMACKTGYYKRYPSDS